MLRNVSPLAPIVVLATFSAVPVVVVMVFTTSRSRRIARVLVATFTVPPPVAVNAALAPVDSVMPPLKVNVDAALLPVSETPAPDVTLSEPA